MIRRIYLIMNKTDDIKNIPTILIIEDEADIRELLEIVLKKENFNVIIAKNGQEGLLTFKKIKNNVDIIVLDLTLPDLNGEELFNLFIDLNPEIDIIISTGVSPNILPQKVIKNAARLLKKPYSLDEFIATIKEILVAAVMKSKKN